VTALLTVRGVETYYGSIQALKGIDIDVAAGEIVTLIGANGAGKSTLMMTICGSPQARRGTVVYDGTDITRMPTHRIMRRGIAQSPEGRRIFPRMSVFENLQMGASLTDPAFFTDDLDKVFALFPRLKERQEQRGGTLSGGEQQMLAMARVLRTGAKLLLLDEITEGLAPVIVKKLGEVIVELKKRGFTIILVEQNFRFAAPLADRHYVLEHGEIIATISQQELPGRMDWLHQTLGV